MEWRFEEMDAIESALQEETELARRIGLAIRYHFLWAGKMHVKDIARTVGVPDRTVICAAKKCMDAINAVAATPIIDPPEETGRRLQFATIRFVYAPSEYYASGAGPFGMGRAGRMAGRGRYAPARFVTVR